MSLCLVCVWSGGVCDVGVVCSRAVLPWLTVVVSPTRHQIYRHTFTGQEAAEWFTQNMEGIETYEAAQAVGQKFLELGLIVSIKVALPPGRCGGLCGLPGT